MVYDKELDKCLWTKKAIVGNFTFEVSVMQYSEGVPKVQITRRINEGDRWAKLGRLTQEELEAILPMLKEAEEKLKQ